MVQEAEVSNTTTLHNISDVAQHVFIENRRETIYPKQTRPFPKSIAKQFLEECPKYVRIYMPSKMPEMDGFGRVWMANITGNPFLRPTVTLKRKVHGEWTTYEKANPLLNAFPIRELISRGQTIQAASEGDGEESLNHPKLLIEIPPFERLLVPHPLAEIIQARDDARDIEWRGQVSHCRAPHTFEANDTWSYEDVRLYAALFDPTTFKTLLRGDGGNFPPEEAFKHNQRAIAETKKKLLDMLFFRYIDERYPWVDEREFTYSKKQAEDAQTKRGNNNSTRS